MPVAEPLAQPEGFADHEDAGVFGFDGYLL